MKRFRTNDWTILALIAACLGFLLLIYLSCFHAAKTATATASVKPLVVLDAGHGGEDGGAVGCSPVPEKVINLAITQKVQKKLEAAGCRVVMTRREDVMLGDASLSTLRERKSADIHQRLAILQGNPGGIFVSIHQNHFSDSYYSGAQIFYSPNHPKSQVLAETIRAKIVSQVQPQNTRKNKEATSAIYLLKHAEDPAVLVECGFLSNASEAKLLNTEAYQQKMADAIADGILDYLRQPQQGNLYSGASSAIMNQESQKSASAH